MDHQEPSENTFAYSPSGKRNLEKNRNISIASSGAESDYEYSSPTKEDRRRGKSEDREDFTRYNVDKEGNYDSVFSEDSRKSDSSSHSEPINKVADTDSGSSDEELRALSSPEKRALGLFDNSRSIGRRRSYDSEETETRSEESGRTNNWNKSLSEPFYKDPAVVEQIVKPKARVGRSVDDESSSSSTSSSDQQEDLLQLLLKCGSEANCSDDQTEAVAKEQTGDGSSSSMSSAEQQEDLLESLVKCGNEANCTNDQTGAAAKEPAHYGSSRVSPEDQTKALAKNKNIVIEMRLPNTESCTEYDIIRRGSNDKITISSNCGKIAMAKDTERKASPFGGRINRSAMYDSVNYGKGNSFCCVPVKSNEEDGNEKLVKWKCAMGRGDGIVKKFEISKDTDQVIVDRIGVENMKQSSGKNEAINSASGVAESATRRKEATLDKVSVVGEKIPQDSMVIRSIFRRQ